MTPKLRQLHATAMRAFAEAREIAEGKPQRGSEQWHRWQELSKAAMKANGEYIEELETFHKLSAPDHATAN